MTPAYLKAGTSAGAGAIWLVGPGAALAGIDALTIDGIADGEPPAHAAAPPPASRR